MPKKAQITQIKNFQLFCVSGVRGECFAPFFCINIIFHRFQRAEKALTENLIFSDFLVYDSAPLGCQACGGTSTFGRRFELKLSHMNIQL